MPQKFTVTFSDRSYLILNALGKQLDVPMADVLRESIALMWRVTQALAEGDRVYIKGKADVTELSLPTLEQIRAAKILGEREGGDDGRETDRLQSPADLRADRD